MNDVDIKQLEKSFLDVDAELRATRVVISNLEQENKHLRLVIEMLITSKLPSS